MDRQPQQEVIAMLSPSEILSWLTLNVKDMRLSRLKTLAAIVPAAMSLLGVGVLALGRSMQTGTSCKHNIKRVDRFLGNGALETESLARAIFEAFVPRTGRALVLADWTDMANARLLVFSLPANGRSIPFFGTAVPKKAGDGALIQAENEALAALQRICRNGPKITLVADRGFGNQRWIPRASALGFHFVQRLSGVFYAETEHYIGKLDEMTLRRGARIRDWGRGVLGEDQAIRGRLVTAFDPDAKEPWYLITDLEDASKQELVSIYRRRWWIETTFRDNKNRDWGLGLASVFLKDYQRYERLFYIVALAFIFLSAHGAAAEAQGFDKGCKANTSKRRVLNLLRLGHIFIRKQGAQLQYAIEELARLTLLARAPNWG
jgi:hypothetical protein